MAADLLLDTSALVSLLDRTQRRHADCVAVLEAWAGRLVTTEAVLTEATHLLGRTPGGPAACLDFVIAGGAVLVPLSRTALRRCRALIERYADVPMDFADAALVVLAEDLDTPDVFTLDRRGFETYRFHGRRPFTLHPQQDTPSAGRN